VSTVLLDTDVFSYLFKNHPVADLYRFHLKEHTLAISFMTVAELFEGAFRAGWNARRMERLRLCIRSYTVIPSDNNLSKRWGEVRFIRRTQPISTEDAWMAAVALERGWPLATHNARDFHGLPGLRIITEQPLPANGGMDRP
jgi:tRNA(fMet)-specific endonuclease VapC